MCATHYGQWYAGKPLTPIDTRYRTRQSSKSVEAKFFEKVTQDGECWRWTGTLMTSGHGSFWVRGIAGSYEGMAYRWAYEFFRGEIPDALVCDHLCRNRWCVNPWHLDLVPVVVNTMRGMCPQAINARKTHCIHGHEFTPENTIPRGGSERGRRCRTCDNAMRREKRQRLRANAA